MTWLPPTKQVSLPILKLYIFLIKYKPISSKSPPASSGELTDGGKSTDNKHLMNSSTAAAAFGVSVSSPDSLVLL